MTERSQLTLTVEGSYEESPSCMIAWLQMSDVAPPNWEQDLQDDLYVRIC